MGGHSLKAPPSGRARESRIWSDETKRFQGAREIEHIFECRSVAERRGASRNVPYGLKSAIWHARRYENAPRCSQHPGR